MHGVLYLIFINLHYHFTENHIDLEKSES